jgi:hypothetical protein
MKKPSTPRPKPLFKMDAKELEAELRALPSQIDKAREVRDQLTRRLMEIWPTAMVNDAKFVEAHLRAEAAGADVISLTMRWLKAGRLYKEMTSGTFIP